MEPLDELDRHLENIRNMVVTLKGPQSKAILEDINMAIEDLDKAKVHYERVVKGKKIDKMIDDCKKTLITKVTIGDDKGWGSHEERDQRDYEKNKEVERA